jgi:D-alanyl-D-alanine carboxypeptidase
MKPLQKTIGALTLAFAVAAAPFPLTAGPAKAHHTQTPAEKQAFMVVNAKTGALLDFHDKDKKVHPASLTKIVTLMMVFDELESGDISLQDKIVFSKNAAAAVPVKLGIAPGSSINVETAINALAVRSANDVAVAIAEHIGGTEKNFARLMTAKARSIGMTDTRFSNASGLPERNQVTTASDMVKLGVHLFQNYKKHYHYFSKKSFTYNGQVYRGHNRLLDSYSGTDGIKTGYIRNSGFNLLTSVNRNGEHVIAVYFGGRSASERNRKMMALLDQAFDTIKLSKSAIANSPSPRPRQLEGPA